ncbi:hypothetical protein ABC977_17790 [Thioalkalicoccus limnaeus]|uniref:Uncharacterized protein n=1 Tax=Thioalkalicoccus limnaeus TaxID=120681 RepID=A0ABV4BLV5_9GAMM
MFKKKPICEVCGNNEATAFSFIVRDSDSFEGDWKFVCECTAEKEDYYILIQSFFSRPPAAVDWLAHMHEKSWMDWKNFMEMIYRFRSATDSFGAL